MSIEKRLRPAVAATGLYVGVGRCAGCLMLGREKYDDELVREYSCFRAHDESDTYVEVIRRPLDSFQQSFDITRMTTKGSIRHTEGRSRRYLPAHPESDASDTGDERSSLHCLSHAPRSCFDERFFQLQSLQRIMPSQP